MRYYQLGLNLLSRRTVLGGLAASACCAWPAYAKRIRVERYRLANGLRVFLVPNDSGMIAARISVNYGAINDDIAGTAHLLEHVMFGKTRRYSPQDIINLSSNLGKVNATVELEWLSSTAEMMAGRLEDYLGFAADAFFEPSFDRQHVESEKQSILEEIAYSTAVASRMRTELLGEQHPLVRNQQGTKESIQSVDDAKLQDFHAAGIHPNLMTIILVGSLPVNVKRVIEKHFGSVPSRNVKRRQVGVIPPLVRQRVIDDNSSNTASTMADVEIGWTLPVSWTSPEVYSLKALLHLLGGDVYYNRLNQALGVRNQLTYKVGGLLDIHAQGSAYVIRFSTTRNPMMAVTKAFAAMQTLRDRPVTERMLQAWIEYERYRYLTRIQSNSGIRDLLFEECKTGIHHSEHEDGMAVVTTRSIRDAARRYLPTRDGNFVLIVNRYE